MLRKFSIKGFRGFKNKLTFDLTRAREYEFNRHLIHDGLVSSGVIYGVNGSGKSSLGFAIFDIVGVLTDCQLALPMLDKTSYLNVETDNNVASFSYEFLLDNDIIVYSYDKTAPDEIIKEELFVNGKEILKRDKGSVKYNEISNIIFPNNLSSNLSALRFIYRNTQLDLKNAITKIIKFVEKMLWFRSLRERGYCGYTMGRDNIIEKLYEKKAIQEFEEFLFEVANIKMKLEVIQTNTTDNMELYIKYPKGTVKFFNAASTGTNELLLLFYWSKIAFNDLKFLFIDEFDAFYHFELSEKIVKMISEKSNMQSFFTSHNTYLANNSVMRPDCFFIISNGEIKSFSDATTRELREGHNLEKLFRSGEFGV